MFADVAVSGTAAQTVETCDDSNTNWVDFKGTYAPVTFEAEDKSVLFLGTNNTLYYPKPDDGSSMTIGTFRAYFQLKNDLVAGSPNTPNGIRAFNVNFGDERATGILQISNDAPSLSSWYTIDGRRLQAPPTTPGIYIHNGRKLMIQ